MGEECERYSLVNSYLNIKDEQDKMAEALNYLTLYLIFVRYRFKCLSLIIFYLLKMHLTNKNIYQ